MTAILAIVSLIISIGNFCYNLYTFEPTHRPFIGVTSALVTPEGDPRNGLTWTLVVKNVGAIPAILTLEEYRSVLNELKTPVPLPVLGVVTSTHSYVMPGETVNYVGAYRDAAGIIPVNQVLDGSVPLDIYLRISYHNPGLIGRKKHYYAAHFRFSRELGLMPPAFETIAAEGD